MKAIEIKCPVEKCGVPSGQLCKLVDMQKHPMFGRFHVDRVREAGKQEREKNQDARELLTSTNRVVNL